MTYTLFVGDIDESLALGAAKHDTSSTLLTEGQTPTSNNTYYTCVADMGSLDNFTRVCLSAQKIYYMPPDHWKDIPELHSEQWWTEYVLLHVNQTVSVIN